MRGLLAVLVGIAGGLRQAAGQQAVAAGWPLAPTGQVRIWSAEGTIRVIGWDRDSVAVTGTVARGVLRGGGSPQGIKVVVEPEGGASGPADLELRLPSGASVAVRSAGAGIEVLGLEGTLDLVAVGGGISVFGTPAEVAAETMSGAIQLAGGTPRARLRTVSGAITLYGAAFDVRASTLSGPIAVRAARPRGAAGVARGRFESVSGDIRFDGILAPGGTLELESQNGRVEARLPGDLSADVSVVAVAGVIENRLTPARPTRRPDGRGQELRFTAGSGDAAVTIRTFKGAVVLAPRGPTPPSP